jgi:hypothetical protein
MAGWKNIKVLYVHKKKQEIKTNRNNIKFLQCRALCNMMKKFSKIREMEENQEM